MVGLRLVFDVIWLLVVLCVDCYLIYCLLFTCFTSCLRLWVWCDFLSSYCYLVVLDLIWIVVGYMLLEISWVVALAGVDCDVCVCWFLVWVVDLLLLWYLLVEYSVFLFGYFVLVFYCLVDCSGLEWVVWMIVLV